MCLVAVLRRLFKQDPRSPNAPLFRLLSVAFSCQNVIVILKKRIASAGLSEPDFSGHSFRKRTANQAADNGMLDKSIQRLGRWTSNAIKLYFTTMPETLFNLNLSFQKGISLAVSRGVVSEPVISSKSVEAMREGKGGNSPYISPYLSLVNHIYTLSFWARYFGQDCQPGQAKPGLDLRTPSTAGSLAVLLPREHSPGPSGGYTCSTS